MYYLQSRYYDPDTGRFINADDVAFLGATGTALSCNLFAYCENNPVNCSDPSGYVKGWIIVAGAIIGGIYELVYYLTHTPKNNRTVLKAVKAFVIGAIVGGIVGLIVSGKTGLLDGIVSAIASVATYLGEIAKLHKSFSVFKFVQVAVSGFAAGAISGVICNKIAKLFKMGKSASTIASAIVGAFIGGYTGAW